MWVNLNYKTTCFGLWRPSSGLDPGTLKREESWVASGVERGRGVIGGPRSRSSTSLWECTCKIWLRPHLTLPTIFYICTLTVTWKNEISVLQWTPLPLSTPLATQLFSRFRVPGSRPDGGLHTPKHVVLKLRFTHISCNKLVCNSCLVRNLNS